MTNLSSTIFPLTVLPATVDVLGIAKYAKMETWLILMWKLFNKKNVGVIIVSNEFLFCCKKKVGLGKKWTATLVF